MELNYDITLENCPEWAITMIKPVVIFYSENGNKLEDGSLTSTFRYLWEKIDDVNFKCHIYLLVQFTKIQEGQTTHLPLYMDLNLYFVNLREFHEIHKFEKQI